MPTEAAGLLLYRINENSLPEVLLVHPGGPFWRNKNNSSWSIPKGHMDDDETDLFQVALREFSEETGFTLDPKDFKFDFLGSVRSKDKRVSVWAFEGNLDPSLIVSNTIMINWPPKTDNKLEIPEIDRGEFFTLEQARLRLVKYQVEIIDMFENFLITKI